MKNYIFCIIALACCINSYAQLSPDEETVTTKILFETTDFTTDDYGRENIYTAITSYKGNVYFVYIDALRRPILGKIDQQGIVSTSRLDKNEEDVYYVQEDGHNKFSLGIDKKGYIHLVGDMHNYGAQTSQNYVDRYVDYNHNENPNGANTIMYWVSKNPENINSFEFVGGDEDRKVPGNGFTYTSFHTDMNGELYIRNRSRVAPVGHYNGEMGWTASKYNVDTKQWIELGAKPPSDGFPNNYESTYKAVFWEDNGVSTDNPDRNWYQGFSGYMRFDYNNRCHFAASINNDNDNDAGMTDIMYAYSDDGGLSFNKVDGTPINELPIRAESGAGQGSTVINSLDPGIGFHNITTLCTDKEGTPMVTFNRQEAFATSGSATTKSTYKYWDQNNDSWSEEKLQPSGSSEGMLLDANGIVSYISSGPDGLITRKFGSEPIETNVYEHYHTWLDAFFYSVDQKGIKEQNVIRGFSFDKDEEVQTLRILEIEGTPNLTSISEEWSTITIGNTTGENGMFNDIYQLKSTGVFEEDFSGQYINQTIEGDFELEARIINVNYVNDASFAGLMIQNNNEEDSSFFGVAVTSYEGVKTISKDNSGETNMIVTEGYEPSEWLKIKRTGNLLKSYRSDNGENWMELDSKEIEMNETVSYGLVAGSGNMEEQGHARLDHVSLTKMDSLGINITDQIMEIFPNPVKDVLYVKLPSTSDSLISARIVNMLGLQVSEEITFDTLEENLYAISTEFISSGTYIIIINSELYNVSKKFVKE